MYYQNNYNNFDDEYQLSNSPNSRADLSAYGSNLNNDNLTTPYGSTNGIGRTDYLLSESKMSNRQNIYFSLDYINQELHGMGMVAPITLSTAPEVIEDNQRINNADYQQDMSSKLRKSLLDEELMLEKICKLKDQLGNTERKLYISESKAQKLTSSLRNADNISKKAVSDLKIARSAFEANKLQLGHESKRKEQETFKLKERMQKMLIEKHKGAKIDYQVINPISNTRGEQETISELMAERRLVDDLIKNYEINENEIIAEKNKLSDAVYTLYNHHYSIYKDCIEGSNNDLESFPTIDQIDFDSPENNSMNKYILAVNHSKLILENIYSSLLKNNTLANNYQLEKVTTLEEYHKKSIIQINDLKNNLSELEYKLSKKDADLQENELNIKKKLAEQQDQSIQMLHFEISKLKNDRHKIYNSLFPFMDGSDNLEDCISDLIKRKDELEKDEMKLKNDQIQYKEAILLLEQERIEVEKLRQNLKMYQISSKTADFLSTLPPTPLWLKNTDLSLPTPELNKRLQQNMDNTPISSMQLSSREISDGFNNTNENSNSSHSLNFSRKSLDSYNIKSQKNNQALEDKYQNENIKNNYDSPDIFRSYNTTNDRDNLQSIVNDFTEETTKTPTYNFLRKRAESKTEINQNESKTNRFNPPTTSKKSIKSKESDSNIRSPGLNSAPIAAISTQTNRYNSSFNKTSDLSLNTSRKSTLASNKLFETSNMSPISMKNNSNNHKPSIDRKGSRPSVLEIQTKNFNDSTPTIISKTSGLLPKTISKRSSIKFCTKPGCAAHKTHYHEDGTVYEVISHELKPPVPKYRPAK
ncbi:hypothetical protein BB561_002542 [Smittium simulii]|uniref:Uncharacterized protein n=1 Tax=Smittium simulii TaxID=133385 RepID=A0A2T9YQ71_9FUNG|nr:hypothetical protein BB561_002542 [Smittium simulii]